MLTAGSAVATARQRAWFAGAVAVGAVVRLGQLVAKWDAPLQFNDSFWYSAQAAVLARGDGFAAPFEGVSSAEHGPLTPLLLALVSWPDDPVPWQRAAMTLLGVLVVVGIGFVAARAAGWSVGVVAAWIAAVYPNLWMNDALVMSETVAAAAVVAVLWFGLRLVDADEPRVRRAALGAGVAIALAGLARSELILLVPAVGGLVWWHRRSVRPVAALAGAAVLVLLPWIVPNLIRFDRPVVLTTNDGATLYGANCPESWSGGDVGGWSVACVFGAPEVPGEDASERSARLRSLAIEHVRDHWEQVPRVVLARAGRGLDLYGLSSLVGADVGDERWEWASWSGIVAFWVLAPAAVVGAVLVRRPDRDILVAPVAVVALTVLAFYGGHRLRIGAEPSVVVLAAVAVVAAAQRVRVGRTS